jgi:HEAT repeat protein
MTMGRRTHFLVAAALAAILARGGTPAARADRLGGNYRGPDDIYVVREDDPKGDPGTTGGKPGSGSGGSSGGQEGGADGSGGGGSTDSGDTPPPPGDGHNRGPAGDTPPDSRQPEDPPTPDPGGGGDTGTGTTASGGSSGSGGSASPGSPSGGSVKGGKNPHDDRDRIWPFYFECAKEEYLASVLSRRPDVRISPPRTSTWFLSLQPAPSRSVRPIDDEDRREALDLAMGRLRDPDSHVRDAAVISLGKSGSRAALPYLEMTATRDADAAVREDALLALGLSGRGDEALPVLLGALATPASGPLDRRSAYAALGLGLLGDRDAAAEPLRALYRAASGRPGREEEAIAAATALGMLGDGGALPLFEKVLASRNAGDPVKSFTLHAVGKFGSLAGVDSRRTALGILTAALKEKKELKRSALLALGSFGGEDAIALLVEEGLTDPDSYCRNFAAHSLGRIAGRLGPASREYGIVERRLARLVENDRRDRCLFQAGNLALSTMACTDCTKQLVEMAGEMGRLNTHSASSVVLSLGLLGSESPAAAKEIHDAFESRTAGTSVQAYAGLAMAMTEAPGSAEALATALKGPAAGGADVARSAALAVGLVGGAKEADLLVEVLLGKAGCRATGGDRFFVLGAAVQGLGLIGDGDTVAKLRPLLECRDSWQQRAFATATLGYILEREPANRVSPRISGIFRHHDYLMAVPLVRAVQSTL